VTDEQYRDLVARLNPTADVTLVDGEVRLDYGDGPVMRIVMGDNGRPASITDDTILPAGGSHD
jgi:hypothetical protein